MKKIKVKIKKLNPEAKIPLVGTEHAAAFDFYSIENATIEPGETKALGTGIAMELPKGMACYIWDRSSLGLKGIHRLAGLIDSDYRGEYKIVLNNTTKQTFTINKHDRIAQGSIKEYYTPEFELVEDLNDTQRGQGGFGSTGK
jgi:dUTP pyrophosphatase